MKLLRSATEAEVEAAFVRAELDSPRFREDVLAGRRGWRIGGLFTGLPEDIAWERVALEQDELFAIQYINWHWWLTVSGGTRSPVDAASRIQAGLVPDVTAERERPIAARLATDDPPPELIVVRAGPEAPLVVVEGHGRLTAYALYPEFLPPALEVFLGTSARMAEWVQY